MNQREQNWFGSESAHCGLHLVWSLLVAAGWAQAVIDFILWAHMIRPIYMVRPFEPVAVVTLVAVTFAIGYALGVSGAAIWNRLQRAAD